MNNSYHEEMYEEDFCRLVKERDKLLAMDKKVLESLKKAPNGAMRAEMAKKKYPQYYLIERNENHVEKRYLKKAESKLIHSLAAKEYNEKIREVIEKRLSIIDRFISMYKKTDLNEVYKNMPEAKRRLITPYTVSDEEYITGWKESFGKEKNPYQIISGSVTEQGEIVRSKSEKMIADKLYYSGIPYVYEPPLYLANGRTLFPDFALLNIRKRKTVYLEHFGRMDDPEYLKGVIDKLEVYAENSIFSGKQLLITMETLEKPLNLKYLEKLIKEYLL